MSDLDNARIALRTTNDAIKSPFDETIVDVLDYILTHLWNKASQVRPDDGGTCDQCGLLYSTKRCNSTYCGHFKTDIGSKTETILFETVAHGWRPNELLERIVKVVESNNGCTLKIVKSNETKEDAVSKVRPPPTPIPPEGRKLKWWEIY